MFKFGDDKGQLKCSFCGKAQEQVKKLIAGPGGEKREDTKNNQPSAISFNKCTEKNMEGYRK